MTAVIGERWCDEVGLVWLDVWRSPHLPRSATSMWIPSNFPHISSPYQISIMSENTDQQKKERFAPKEAVTLQPPKDDLIEREYLAKCDGNASQPRD